MFEFPNKSRSRSKSFRPLLVSALWAPKPLVTWIFFLRRSLAVALVGDYGLFPGHARRRRRIGEDDSSRIPLCADETAWTARARLCNLPTY